MEHGRRTGWAGRPRPCIRVRSPQRFARLLQPGPCLTGSSNFGPLSTALTSSWRHILERSSREIPGISNRFWVKNRTYRKQTIKACLTGARTAIKLFEIRQISAQNRAALNWRSRERFVNFRPFLPGATTAHSCLTVQPSDSHSGPVFPARIFPSIELTEGGEL
jgi:hypothetical protein